MTELKPCPFHIETFYPSFSGEGTQANLSCDECGTFWECQISNLMTIEERSSEEGKFDMKTYRYAEKFIERAGIDLIERWNIRAPSKDRELLVELSKPNTIFDDLCNEAFVSNTVTDGKTTLLLGNSIEFTERDTKEGAEARIALRIRKHLEENPSDRT